MRFKRPRPITRRKSFEPPDLVVANWLQRSLSTLVTALVIAAAVATLTIVVGMHYRPDKIETVAFATNVTEDESGRLWLYVNGAGTSVVPVLFTDGERYRKEYRAHREAKLGNLSRPTTRIGNLKVVLRSPTYLFPEDHWVVQSWTFLD